MWLERVDPHISIMVSDTGKGIAPDFLPYVFDRFRQAKSESAVPSRARRVGLAKAIEDTGQEIGGNPFARIAHHDADVRIYAFQPHCDASSLRRELDCVGEQVPNHLLQTGRVTGNLAYIEWELSLK